MSDDATGAAVVLRRAAGDRWSVVLLTGIVAVPAIGLAVGAAYLATVSPALAVLCGGIAVLMAGLTYLMVDEARVRWATRITLGPDGLGLHLPARRGYVRLDAVDAVVPWSRIRAVEMRSEAFRSAGTTVLQVAYAVRLDDGTRVVLGGDRRMVAPFFGDAAAAITARSGVPLVDRGMIDGHAGFLLIRGQTVPDWDAAPLPPAAEATRTRQESRAWQLVGWAMLLVVVARALAAFLK